MATRTRKADVGLRALLMAAVGLLLAASPALAVNSKTYGGGSALMTTINYDYDQGNYCHNGKPGDTTVNNCNEYAGKQYVWFNGGPSSAEAFPHGDGYYFFVVMVPGGKSGSYNDAVPADKSDANLSDDFDSYKNRTFHVTGGVIDSTLGNHILAYDSQDKAEKLNVAPYSTTTNAGGDYQLDVCWLGKDDPTANYPIENTSDCAPSDNFKVGKDQTPPECPAVDFLVDNGNNIAKQQFRDEGGLEKIQILDMTNVNFTMDPPSLDYNEFPTGTTGWVTLIATQINKGQFTQAQILAWDVGGNATICDPVMTRLKVRRHHPVVQRFRVSSSENKVVIKNARHGLRRLRISVNGHSATLRLRPGQHRVLKIGALLTRKHNRIVLKGYGHKGARAFLTVAH